MFSLQKPDFSLHMATCVILRREFHLFLKPKIDSTLKRINVHNVQISIDPINDFITY